MKIPTLAIVVPSYNEEEVLEETSKHLLKVLNVLEKKNKVGKGSFILFVDDGSTDKTWDIIERLSKANDKCRGLKFSRNYGHQNALFAGLMYSKDFVDCVISIDADLQQDENMMETFIDKYNEGFEIVNGIRKNRNTDSFFKRVSATVFYSLMNVMGVQITPDSADYRLVSSRVLKELSKFEEVNLFLRGLFPTLGFRTTFVEHEVKDRFAGKSKYSLKKMVNLAMDGITSFSIAPLRIITFLGIISLFLCFCMILYVLYTVIFTDNAVAGWASTVLPLYFIGSIQILSLGVIGEYVGRIYMETKHRPKYLIEKITPQLRQKSSSKH